MRVLELARFGDPPGLELVERPERAPGPNQVAVELVAAALNRRDLWIARGGRIELPAVLGSDGAGIVSAVGEAVDDVRVGDEIVIDPALEWGDAEEAPGPRFRILGVPDDGTHAERVVVDAAQVRPRPARLSWIEAAALPLAGLTAWRAVVTHAAAGPGRRILVPGAGGGVATFAVQIAAALGAEVVVTSSSAAKLARARTLGAAAGADYRDPGWADALTPVDAVVDGVGGAVWPGAIRALRLGGRLVNFADTAGEEGRIELATLFFKHLRIQGTTMGSPREFDALLAHVAAATWRPVVDSVFPLAEAADAYRRLDAPDRFGKVVLAIDTARIS